jgi:hypothetical protein
MGRTTNESVASMQPGKSEGEDRREKRRAANRRSAQKSRYREMIMLDELQRNTRDMSLKNSALKQKNESLRNMILTIKKVKAEQQQVAGVVSLFYPVG